MNPFRITLEENNIEKRNFLKSLVLLIWKGADAKVNNVEEMLIDTVIAKYYDYYLSFASEFSHSGSDSQFIECLFHFFYLFVV